MPTDRVVTLMGVCNDTRSVSAMTHTYDDPTRPYRYTFVCGACGGSFVDDSGRDPLEASFRVRNRVTGSKLYADTLLRDAVERGLPVTLDYNHDRPGFVLRQLLAINVDGVLYDVL